MTIFNPSQQLRADAEGRLHQGTAPATLGWHTGEQALIMLHKLASNPASAGAALKLLHELQVHQIELDMQHEQAEQNFLELNERLNSYVALFDLMPIGYLLLDRQGHVHELNQAAAATLGQTQALAKGRLLCELLLPECGAATAALLWRISKQPGPCEMLARPLNGLPVVRLIVNAEAGAGAERMIATCWPPARS